MSIGNATIDVAIKNGLPIRQQSPSSNRQAAWQREMEQAQISTWFLPFQDRALQRQHLESAPQQIQPHVFMGSTHSRSSVEHEVHEANAQEQERHPYHPPSSSARSPGGYQRSSNPSIQRDLVNVAAPSKSDPSTAPVFHEDAAALAIACNEMPMAEYPPSTQSTPSTLDYLDIGDIGETLETLRNVDESIEATRSKTAPDLLPVEFLSPAPPVAELSNAKSIVNSNALPALPASTGRMPGVTGLASSGTMGHSKVQEGEEADWAIAGKSALNFNTSAVDRLDTRLHTQWQDGLVNVWLGMDGDADRIAARTAVLMPELHRQLRAQGYRLGRVVCNGNVVSQDAEILASHPANRKHQQTAIKQESP